MQPRSLPIPLALVDAVQALFHSSASVGEDWEAGSLSISLPN